jgi:hypothetical protein
MALSYFAIGNRLRKDGELQKAMESFQCSLDSFQKTNHHRGMALSAKWHIHISEELFGQGIGNQSENHILRSKMQKIK